MQCNEVPLSYSQASLLVRIKIDETKYHWNQFGMEATFHKGDVQVRDTRSPIQHAISRSQDFLKIAWPVRKPGVLSISDLFCLPFRGPLASSDSIS